MRRISSHLLASASCGVLLLVALAPLASRADSPSHGDLAIQAARVGDLPRARAELAQLPSDKLHGPQALLIEACLALEAGDWQAAAESLRALQTAQPNSPEALVLQKLIALRRAQPDQSWPDAYVRAWKDAGRPDLEHSPLIKLQDDDALPELHLEDISKWKLDPETQLVVALTDRLDPEHARVIVPLIPTLVDPGWAIAVHDLAGNKTLPEDLRTEMTSAIRQRWPAIIDASPNAMDLRLMALLDDTDDNAPFTAEEMLELEEIAWLPEWRSTDFHDVFERANHHLAAVNIPNPPRWGLAFSTAVSTLVGSSIGHLQYRTKASLATFSPAGKQRLGEVLWQIGSNLAIEPTLVEHLVGVYLMRKGAQAMDDTARLDEAGTLRADTWAAWAAWKKANGGCWPIPSLQKALLEDHVRDEVANMRKYFP